MAGDCRRGSFHGRDEESFLSGTGRDAVDDSIHMLISRLETLDDPRQAGKVSYPLVEMAMVAVAGVIADCDGWEDVADFGRDRVECVLSAGVPELPGWCG